MWHAPSDPQIYGTLDLDARPVLRLIEREREHGRHVTPTHVVGRAVAHALEAVPDLNVRILGGRAIPRETIDVFFIAAVGGGGDLSGVKVKDVPAKSVGEVAEEVARRAGSMKRGNDPDFKRTKKLMEQLPLPILRAALRLTAFASNELQLDLPALRRPPQLVRQRDDHQRRDVRPAQRVRADRLDVRRAAADHGRPDRREGRWWSTATSRPGRPCPWRRRSTTASSTAGTSARRWRRCASTSPSPAVRASVAAACGSMPGAGLRAPVRAAAGTHRVRARGQRV